MSAVLGDYEIGSNGSVVSNTNWRGLGRRVLISPEPVGATVRSLTRPGETAELLERIRETVSYFPATGELRWRVNVGTQARAGSLAGGINSNGYVAFKFERKHRLGHRVAFALFHGRWPSGMVDHINGDPADNRIENLREETPRLNSHNRKAPSKTNKLGLLGVRARNGRFIAQISINRRMRHIGVFDTAEEASAAYWAAKRALHEGVSK